MRDYLQLKTCVITHIWWKTYVITENIWLFCGNRHITNMCDYAHMMENICHHGKYTLWWEMFFYWYVTWDKSHELLYVWKSNTGQKSSAKEPYIKWLFCERDVWGMLSHISWAHSFAEISWAMCKRVTCLTHTHEWHASHTLMSDMPHTHAWMTRATRMQTSLSTK